MKKVLLYLIGIVWLLSLLIAMADGGNALEDIAETVNDIISITALLFFGTVIIICLLKYTHDTYKEL